MKVFVTGGTGFVGTELVRQLTGAGHVARLLIRPGSEGRLAEREGVEIHLGDATDPSSLSRALAGCHAVIHLVGIIREFPSRGITFEKLHTQATRNLVAAAQQQGVGRFVHMSANGTRAGAACPYHQTKWEAEQAVRGSTLEWTIFRPSLIFGPGDAFVNMLADLIRRLPLVPVIGDGRYRMSPVSVADVAAGFVRALGKPESIGQTYACGGPGAYSYDEILDLVGAALGKEKVFKLHHPLALMKPVVSLLENFPLFPLTRSQMSMLLEGNTCDPGPWVEAFDLKLTPFPEGIRSYLRG